MEDLVTPGPGPGEGGGARGSASADAFDFAVVGGGIVGLSTGLALTRRFPDARIVLLEKEAATARHQTGRNSGVIHSGIYYPPGSLKARFALEGKRAMVRFCREQGIDHEVCGKVIVATEPEELPRLETLFDRGKEHGLEVRKLDPDELRELEPHVSGLAGIHVPSTGVVDYGEVAAAFARLFEERGGEVRLATEVLGLEERDGRLRVDTSRDGVEVRFLVNCAGLHADRVAGLAGVRPEVRIVPFRGEYYAVRPGRRHLVRGPIYPVPDPRFPFLGVHFTRGVDGSVHAGPNAVLALAREGYGWSEVDLRDLRESLSWPGLWRLAADNWRYGLDEVLRSLSRRRFVRSLQRLVPEIREDDVKPAPAGVRAQALDRRGGLVDDFLIVEGPRSLHVLNAPSPAATASIPIGRSIARRVPAEAVPGIRERLPEAGAAAPPPVGARA